MKGRSLPILSARALSTERVSCEERNTFIQDEHDKSMKQRKSTMSFSSQLSSRAGSIANAGSINKLYERVSASLLSKVNRSTINNEVKKSRLQEMEKPRKVSGLLSLINADIYESFLEPYTKDFMNVVEQSNQEINFDIEDPTEDDLTEFIIQQSDVYTMLKKVIDECVVGKILARNGLEQIGRVIASVIDSITIKYTRVLQACKPQLRVKNLLNQQKEQHAMVVTKNEKTLFEAIRLVNFIQNPMFDLDDQTREKYIHSLLKCKQALRENKTNFRIDTINNFEEDLKKFSRMFNDLKSQNSVLVNENEKLKALFTEVSDRYTEDQKMLKFKNQQIIKGKNEENNKLTNEAQHTNAGGELLITQQPEQVGALARLGLDNNLHEHNLPTLKRERSKGDLTSRIKQRDEKLKDESQTFVVSYLQKDNKQLEIDIAKIKQESEKLKVEKAALLKKIQELEEALQEKTPTVQDAEVQCGFALEKIESAQVENTLEKILEGKDPLRMTAVVQSSEWLQKTINMIYLEKYQADLQDDFDGRPRKAMRAFCREWFVNKFGFQQAAEVFLRDFLGTLSNYACAHPRYKTFGMLIGLDDAYEIKVYKSFHIY